MKDINQGTMLITPNIEVNLYEDVSDANSIIGFNLWVETIFNGPDGETYASIQGYGNINIKKLLPLL